MMYVALYSGPTHKTARLICATVDPEIVVSVAEAGLKNLPYVPDPVLAHLAAGNKKALEEVIRGARKSPRRSGR